MQNIHNHFFRVFKTNLFGFFCRNIFKCFVGNRCIANSQGRSGRRWSRSAVFLNRVTSAHLEEVLMQKPHSFFLSAPRPHARQTTRVRERGTVKSVYTIYFPKLSDYTYFHDDIFFFILQVVPSKGCRLVQGRIRTGKKKVSCHVCGGEKSPWNRASFEFCFCFVFIIIIIFFYVEPQGRRSVKRVFLLIFC